MAYSKIRTSMRWAAHTPFCARSPAQKGECLHAIYLAIYPDTLHVLAGNLFHFKKDQAEYSIKLEDHGSKTLFSKKGASQTLLNEFFFYLLSRVSSWQCMTEFRVTPLDDVKALLLHSFYGFLQESKSGMEMPNVPVVSRYFFAYLASFVAVAPFFPSSGQGRTRPDWDRQVL